MNRMIKGWLSLICFFSILTLSAQNAGVTQIQAGSGIVNTGETICLNITGSGMSSILAMQFSVRWDPAVLEYVEVKNFTMPGQSINDFGFRFVTEGAITFLYLAPPTAVLAPELSLFTLCLRARGAAGTSSFVEISESPTNIEFVGKIGGTEDIIRNYSVVGGSVAIPGAQGPTAPFALLIDKAGQTNCVTTAPARLAVTATGGITPYQYQWSGPGEFSAAGAEVSARRPGTYAVTATDAGGARLRAFFEVDTSKLRITEALLTDAACAGAGNGRIALTAAGGAGALTYRWAHGATGAIADKLTGGAYAVTVSDEVGCAVTGRYDLATGAGIALAPQVTAPTCGQATGVIRLNASSPAGGLTYAWQGGADGAERSGLAPGTYAVTVSDAAGCKASRGFTFSWQPVAVVLRSDCVPTPENSVAYSAMASPSGGRAPYSIQWSTGQKEKNVTLPGPGNYTVTVTDADGCTGEGTLAVDACPEGDPVWPGDTDNDGVVDHHDLLNIGLGYGFDGPPRQPASMEWQAQPGANWSGATPVSRLNFKFADADGNGRIEAADTSAISRYWGRRGDTGFRPPLAPRNDGVALFVAPAPVTPGQTATFDIILGEAALPAAGAYALAFSIVYDSLVVRPGSARIRLDHSWLGAGLLTLSRDFPADHRLDLALTRTDRQGRDGSGAIAQLSLDLTDLPNGVQRYELPFRITDVRLINAAEEELAVDPRSTSVLLEGTTSVNDPLLQAKIRLFPNPAGDYLYLDADTVSIERIELIHADGRRLRSWPGSDPFLTLREYPNGWYGLRLITRQGVVVKPFVIAR